MILMSASSVIVGSDLPSHRDWRRGFKKKESLLSNVIPSSFFQSSAVDSVEAINVYSVWSINCQLTVAFIRSKPSKEIMTEVSSFSETKSKCISEFCIKSISEQIFIVYLTRAYS